MQNLAENVLNILPAENAATSLPTDVANLL